MSVRPDPVLADAVAVRVLAGLSGADIHLVTRDHQHWFVRKAARQPADSARLRLQHAKQQAFAARVGESVRVPRLLGEGERDGRFYFDMEFVRGTDGATYLRQASYAEVRGFADQLARYLRTVAAAAPHRHDDGTPPPADLFSSLYAKIAEVQRRTSAVSPDVLARCLLALEPLARLRLPATLCHGDMTLENLVVDHQGQVWAFDLLNAPFEHYWLDVAKLHQDLDGGWYRLRQPRIAPSALQYVSARLIEVAEQLEPGYAEVHAVLMATTFLRILPYVHGDDDRRFVQTRVEHYAKLARPTL
jgi:aminoglycoside phosphotransferase